MNSQNPPTAYFSSTDNMALAIMEAAVSEGLKFHKIYQSLAVMISTYLAIHLYN